MNYARLLQFDVPRVHGVLSCCSGDRVMRARQTRLRYQFMSEKPSIIGTTVTRSRDDGTQRILFR